MCLLGNTFRYICQSAFDLLSYVWICSCCSYFYLNILKLFCNIQFYGFWQMNGILYHQLNHLDNSSIIVCLYDIHLYSPLLFFSILKILSHFFLACIMYHETYSLICTLIPLYTYLIEVFLFITSFEQFDYDMPWYGFLHFSCALGFLRFLDVWVYNLHYVWKYTDHYFIFFCQSLLTKNL